jgi:crotonobetainyl-CoA:carnitine CoA-transferase CaiB-like acyl-CoA transferase
LTDIRSKLLQNVGFSIGVIHVSLSSATVFLQDEPIAISKGVEGIDMAGVLTGLKILDLTWGVAGPMATMLLGDHGAKVTRIERPTGEPFPLPEGYRVWQRGKRSALLDLSDPTDRQVLLGLARDADVLVESFEPGVADRLGIGFDALHRMNPRLIYCSITGYGRNTRHAHRPGYDALVAARAGLQWEARGWYGTPMERVLGLDRDAVEMDVPCSVGIGSDRDGPIFSATPAASVLTAYLATLGVSAALRARALTGRGQHLETSLLQAIIMGNCAGWQRPEHIDAPGYQFAVSDKRQTWGIVRAKDGWMCTWASPPEWFEAAGAGAELKVPDEKDINRAGGMPSIEHRLEALDRTAPIFRKFTVDEWVRLASESGAVSCQPVRTPEEALCDPALLAEGSVAEIEDPELGLLRQAGILYRLHACETKPAGPAAARGEHTAAVKAEAQATGAGGASDGDATRTNTTEPATGQVLRGPMDGIRIVDFGLAIAGPWASQLLADLGADVVKVDPARQAFWMPTHMSIAVNRSKQCLGLDIKTKQGSAIAHRLVRDADVVVLNMRPQAARKLGLDYETLSEVNPRIIYCHTRGFEDGPRSLLPGNDQTGNALGGTLWEDGGCWKGGRPWFGATSNGDLGNGFLAAIAVVQALLDRDRTGKGQQVDASILNAALFNNSRVVTNRDGQHFDRPALDADQRGMSALYRLYRCAEGWLCIAAINDEHWESLKSVLSDLGYDARFESEASRSEHDESLAETLDRLFAKESAEVWFDRLDLAGVPCEVSSATFSQQIFDDPELLERGWTVRCEGNPILGTIDMFGCGIDFSDTPARAGGPPATPWQDTRSVLRELGHSEDEIEALIASGVALQPAVER